MSMSPAGSASDRLRAISDRVKTVSQRIAQVSWERSKGVFRISRRTVQITTASAIVVAAVGLSASSYAFIRLQSGASGMFWRGAGASPVVYTIDDRGAPGVTDGSDETAIRLAFAQWQDVATAGIFFAEDASPASRARRDVSANDLHMVTFDTSNATGYFSSSSGLVALTPVDFAGNGEILDADVIFNARDHSFSTDMKPGTFDIQNIATHEIGHFIGLDHTGIHGATMNPFAIIGEVRLRSLSPDDVAGVSAIYPSAGYAPGSIAGRVVRSDGSAVRGAHVVASNDQGEPAATALADNTGQYLIQGLPAGSYWVYAEPLDGPVRSQNLSTQTSGIAIDVDFGTSFLGGSLAGATEVFVPGGSKVPVADIVARPAAGMNVTGVNPPVGRPGDVVNVVVFGQGFSDQGTFDVMGPGIQRTGTFVNHTATAATISIRIASSAVPGLRNIIITGASPDDAVALTGGFEIVADAPAIADVTPGTGSTGDTVTIDGDGFAAGATVIIGDRPSGSVQVSGPTTILAEVPGGTPGATGPVTVINPDGQQDRLASAFTWDASSPAPAPAPAPSPTPTVTPAPTPVVAASGGGGGGGGGGGCIAGPDADGGSPLPLLVALAALCAFVRRR